jgi:hypothetical protein
LLRSLRLIDDGSVALRAAHAREREWFQHQELVAKGEISPELIDVFLEKGVFDQAQTRYALTAANRATSVH